MNMAQVAFNKHLQRAEANLKIIKKEMKEMVKAREKMDQSSWEYVGDMQHFADTLEELDWNRE